MGNVLTMTAILEELGILGCIRQRLGAEDSEDTSFDKQINSMTPDELMSEWSAWVLGSYEWLDMKRMYEVIIQALDKRK